MRYLYSTLGLILGFIALCLAAFENHFIASEPRIEDKRTFQELASAAGRKILKEKILKEDAPKKDKQIEPFHPIRITYTLIGLSAMGLGTISWIRKEHIRMSGGAIALGLMAVAWQWVLIGVCIAVVIFLIANFSA